MNTKPIKPYNVGQIQQAFPELVVDTIGALRDFESIHGYQNCGATSLVVINDAAQLPEQAAVIVTTPSIAQAIKEHTDSTIVCVNDPRMAQALLGQRFDDYQAHDAEWPPHHPSAIIHPSAQLGEDCRIGPNVVIGADCRIGDRVIIRSNAVIEHGVSIGNDCIINVGVNIGYNTLMGERVIIQAGAMIGGEGFGFAVDQHKAYQRIPHIGYVEIADDVRIGNNTCIDRGTYGATQIHRGVKIDNLCHIAHNCVIEENALIIAMSGISGSCHIGKRAILSGQTGTIDHVKIADDAVLVHRAGIHKDIPTAGVWAGGPAQPLKEYVRQNRLPKTVSALEKRVKQLEQLLAQNKD